MIRNTERQKAVRELRLQGLCGSEIADRLDIPAGSVAAIAKRVGLPFSDEERKRSQELGHKKKCHTDESLRRLVLRYEPAFVYVGGYTGPEGSLRIRCKECGSETTRSIVSIRHKNVRCRECERIERERRKREQQAEYNRRKWERLCEKLIKPGTQLELKVCPVCNSVFAPAHGRQIYCGQACLRKKFDNKDKRVRRLRALTKDRDISLEGLFRRDKGVCYLCGGMCSWEDMEMREDGTKIAGDWYPSVDHVKPLAKGGAHSWDNIKLAHRGCNTRKSDREVCLPISRV